MSCIFRKVNDTFSIRLPKFQLVFIGIRKKYARFTSHLNRKLKLIARMEPQTSPRVQRNEMANTVELHHITTNESYISTANVAPSVTMKISNAVPIVMLKDTSETVLARPDLHSL